MMVFDEENVAFAAKMSSEKSDAAAGITVMMMCGSISKLAHRRNRCYLTYQLTGHRKRLTGDAMSAVYMC